MANQLTEEMFDWLNANCRADIVDAIQSQADRIAELEKQTKPLSDEEIIDCAGEAGFKWSEEKGIFVRHSNGSWIGIDPYIADFAKAILKKASNK